MPLTLKVHDLVMTIESNKELLLKRLHGLDHHVHSQMSIKDYGAYRDIILAQNRVFEALVELKRALN